jgi:hypothetical protein
MHHVRVEVVDDVDNSNDNIGSDDNVNENGDQSSKLAYVADECRIVFILDVLNVLNDDFVSFLLYVVTFFRIKYVMRE